MEKKNQHTHIICVKINGVNTRNHDYTINYTLIFWYSHILT